MECFVPMDNVNSGTLPPVASSPCRFRDVAYGCWLLISPVRISKLCCCKQRHLSLNCKTQSYGILSKAAAVSRPRLHKTRPALITILAIIHTLVFISQAASVLTVELVFSPTAGSLTEKPFESKMLLRFQNLQQHFSYRMFSLSSVYCVYHYNPRQDLCFTCLPDEDEISFWMQILNIIVPADNLSPIASRSKYCLTELVQQI